MLTRYRQSQRLLRFSGTTLAGLLLDFCIFWILTKIEFSVGLANFISTGFAFALTYLLSSRIVFDSPVSVNTALIYLAWYAFSNATFSLVIETIHASTEIESLQIKIAVLPLSFLVNFAASKKILSYRRAN